MADSLKIIVLGDYGVGKTSLIQRFVRPEAGSADGAGHFVKHTEIDGRRVAVQLWDSGGSGLPADSYASADACVLVFDLNRASSLDSLSSWYDECCRRVGAGRDFPYVVLGNMIDKCGITVEATKNAVAWCVDHGNLPYYETSATEGYNVDRSFVFILEKAWTARQHRQVGHGSTGPGHNPSASAAPPPTFNDFGASAMSTPSGTPAAWRTPAPSHSNAALAPMQSSMPPRSPPQQAPASQFGVSAGPSVVSSGASSSLVESCRRMLNNSRFADVKFVVEGQTIHASKQFLAMRCEGFANTFESQMQRNEFPITDVSYDAFYKLLEFLYTGEIGALTLENLAQVYGISKAYGVDELANHCSGQIESIISPENAAEMLVMMHQTQAAEMYHYVLDFIVRNRETVIVTRGFEELSRQPQLLMEVAKAFASGQ